MTDGPRPDATERDGSAPQADPQSGRNPLIREAVAVPAAGGDVSVTDFAWEGHPLPPMPVEAEALADLHRRRGEAEPEDSPIGLPDDIEGDLQPE